MKCCALSALIAIAAVALPTAAESQSQSLLAEQTYDIPAQPLGAALQQFSKVSRFDLIFNDAVVAGVRSTAVRGRHTPQQAMSILLEGSGLLARFTSSRSVLISSPKTSAASEFRRDDALPELTLSPMIVRSTALIGRRGDHRGYGQKILSGLLDALRSDAQRGGDKFRVELSLWLNGNGTVERSVLTTGSGNMSRDRAMLASIDALRFAPPPTNMPQPIRFQLELR